jgi:predicted RecA/RadA family phage recombinase
MATNFIQQGNILQHTAGADIVSGDLVIIGVIAGVALTDIAEGASGSVQINGVFSLPKASGAITQGALVYWDDDPGQVTTTASENTLIGVAASAAASGDATAEILLNVGL